MLVHLVNKANRSYYEEYIEDMFRLRKEVFVDGLGWKELNVENGKETDEMDMVEDVEYLLTIANNGLLIGCCRCNPTTDKYLLGTAMKEYVQRPFTPGHDVWEFTRLAPTRDAKFEYKILAQAYLSAAIMEWALLKGIKRLIGITETSLVAWSTRLGWKVKMLGMPIEYEPKKEAVALEYTVDMETLNSTRKFYDTKTPVLYIAPPQIDGRKINIDEIQILDAVNNVNSKFREVFSPSNLNIADFK